LRGDYNIKSRGEIMEKDIITIAFKKLFDESMDFRSVREYLFKLASEWQKERLIELLFAVLHRIKVTNDYFTAKRNNEIIPTYGKSLGSENKSTSSLAFGPLIPIFK
jgi:hypothetical protein